MRQRLLARGARLTKGTPPTQPLSWQYADRKQGGATLTHDATSKSSIGTGPLSWTHTPTFTPRGVVVQVFATTQSDIITGVTYGGEAMTRVNFANHTTYQWATITTYFLGSDVPTGAQTVAVSQSSGSTKAAVCHTLNGPGDLAVDAEGVAEGSDDSPTVTLATTASTDTLIYGGWHSTADLVSEFTPDSGFSVLATHQMGASSSAASIDKDTLGTGGNIDVGGTQDVAESWVFSAVAVKAAGTNTLTPDDPGDLVNDDVRFMFAYCRDSGVSIANPTGWTSLVSSSSTGGTLRISYQVYSGQGAPDVDFTGLTSGDSHIAYIGRVRGADTADVIDQTGTPSHNSAAQNVGPVTGITPSDNYTMAIAVFGKADDHTSVDLLSGDGSMTWQDGGTNKTTQGGDATLDVQFSVDPGTTTVTSKTLTVTGGTSAVGCGVIFNINPATSNAPTPTYTLTITTSGSGTGTVTASGISCPGDCVETFYAGTTVQLTAAPDGNNTFEGYTGDLTSSSAIETITMTGDKTIDAEFTTPDPGFTYPTLRYGPVSTKAGISTHYIDQADTSITDTAVGGESIRYLCTVAQTAMSQIRCESGHNLPATRTSATARPIPSTAAYEWDFYVPTATNLNWPNSEGPLAAGAKNICQFHTNTSCYTGGILLNYDDRLAWTVVGGEGTPICHTLDEIKYLSNATISRDTWHTITAYVRWSLDDGRNGTSAPDGFIVLYLDGNEVLRVENIATANYRTSAAPSSSYATATYMKFRTGWYCDPGDNLDMYVRNIKCYGDLQINAEMIGDGSYPYS